MVDLIICVGFFYIAHLFFTMSFSLHKVPFLDWTHTGGDISGMSDPLTPKIISKSGASIVIMHIKGSPKNMQIKPNYKFAPIEIYNFLEKKIELALSEGIKLNRIAIDPGFGFGKTLIHNYKLLNNLKTLSTITSNILVGISRKSMIGDLLNKPVNDRLDGSLAAAVLSFINNAKIIRTHDVRETKIAILVARELIGMNK